MTADGTLKFEMGKAVSDRTFVYQTESGTIFYRKVSTLWVHHEGKKIKVKLNGCYRYSMMAVHGDSIYYGSNFKRKIYRAEFKPPDKIETCFLRDLLVGENIHRGGMCSIKQDDTIYVHRMCDENPMIDRKAVNVPVDKLTGLELQGLFGETVIFKTINPESEPSVKQMGTNAIILTCHRGMPRRFWEVMYASNDMCEYYAPWGSPATSNRSYVYMSNGSSLFVIDPVGMVMLPPLHFWNVSCFHIAGIRGGTLIGRGKSKETGKYHTLTAQLTHEYVTKSESIALSPITMSIESENGVFSSKFLTEFTVKSILGEGAYGCVFEAENTYDHWEYAVKRIAVYAREEELALREVREMARLDHPNIIRYNSTWVEKPPEGWQFDQDLELLQRMGSSKRSLTKYKDDCVFIYIQMQLAKHSLSEWLNDNQDQSARNLHQMKSWFKQIVEGVEYLHRKNIIHRDLKPSNILFVEKDHLKVCDLGIATARRYDEETETDLTRTSNIGTMQYMSPEQRFLRYSSKSDVFTLGLIFAELCVAMTHASRSEIFDDFRSGIMCTSITEGRTSAFIALVTQVDPKNRPTCREMLDHLFLA